jgi:predicted nuclease of predicted toxin-antitoxin system
MRIKLDENLPNSLAVALAERGHDVDTVDDEGISGRDDDVVWRAAQAMHRFLITQDLDFSDIRRYRPGTHHGLLLVRLKNPSATALRGRVVDLFSTEDVERWPSWFVVTTGHKLRVRIPGEG